MYKTFFVSLSSSRSDLVRQVTFFFFFLHYIFWCQQIKTLKISYYYYLIMGS